MNTLLTILNCDGSVTREFVAFGFFPKVGATISINGRLIEICIVAQTAHEEFDVEAYGRPVAVPAITERGQL